DPGEQAWQSESDAVNSLSEVQFPGLKSDSTQYADKTRHCHYTLHPSRCRGNGCALMQHEGLCV
ncbi:hypothetical protein, partial [Leclercia sp.]|uniref:hypothetical protein n=1 Tax=Leclercia sp. TaxID=1898428 RepID=UPI0028AA653E